MYGSTRNAFSMKLCTDGAGGRKQLLFLDRDHASLNKKVGPRLRRGVTDLPASTAATVLLSSVTNHVIHYLNVIAYAAPPAAIVIELMNENCTN